MPLFSIFNSLDQGSRTFTSVDYSSLNLFSRLTTVPWWFWVIDHYPIMQRKHWHLVQGETSSFIGWGSLCLWFHWLGYGTPCLSVGVCYWDQWWYPRTLASAGWLPHSVHVDGQDLSHFTLLPFYAWISYQILSSSAHPQGSGSTSVYPPLLSQGDESTGSSPLVLVWSYVALSLWTVTRVEDWNFMIGYAVLVQELGIIKIH